MNEKKTAGAEVSGGLRAREGDTEEAAGAWRSSRGARRGWIDGWIREGGRLDGENKEGGGGFGWWNLIVRNEGIPRKKGRWVAAVDEMDGTRGENLGLEFSLYSKGIWAELIWILRSKSSGREI